MRCEHTPEQLEEIREYASATLAGRERTETLARLERLEHAARSRARHLPGRALTVPFVRR